MIWKIKGRKIHWGDIYISIWVKAREFKNKIPQIPQREKVNVVSPSKFQVCYSVLAHPIGSSTGYPSSCWCNCIISISLVLDMICLLSHASFNLLPTQRHPNPLCCSFHLPMASLSLWTSFPISLPDAANRPFQILLCPRTKAAQMWGELALGTLTAPSSCPSGMVVVSLRDQRQKKGGGKKKEKTEGRKRGKTKISHWNQKGNAWVRFLSGNSVGGGGVGAGRIKTKEQNVPGGERLKPHKSLWRGKMREEGVGKNMVERSWKAGTAEGWGEISAGISPHPSLSTLSCGILKLSPSSVLFSTLPVPKFHCFIKESSMLCIWGKTSQRRCRERKIQASCGFSERTSTTCPVPCPMAWVSKSPEKRSTLLNVVSGRMTNLSRLLFRGQASSWLWTPLLSITSQWWRGQSREGRGAPWSKDVVTKGVFSVLCLKRGPLIFQTPCH